LAWLKSTLSAEPDAWTQSKAALQRHAAAVATIIEGKLR
jgi:hypothetical protein